MSREEQKEDVIITNEVDEEAVKKLSEGLVSIYQPTLKAMRAQLVEIVKKQEFLCDEMHRENLKLVKSCQNKELQEMFDKIKMYKEKLIRIRKTMVALHEQSAKLKKRALKLEQQKQREALNKMHKREYEELLIQKLPNT